jgi:hypothetical protein
MNAKDLGETLKALIASGKELREAGYVRIEIGEVKLELAKPDAPQLVPVTAGVSEDSNPIDDPDTYGGELPQRRVFSTRPTEREE